MDDFFAIDNQFSADELAVRDSVRRFVDERVMPIIGQCYVDGRFPKEIVPEMASLGVLGANLPEEYGCAGLNNVAYGLIMQELERGDSGVRSFASVQGALAMYPIYALELLHDQPVRDVVESRAAVFFRQIGAEHAERRHFGNDLLRKAAVDVALADDREDAFVHEAPHAVAHGTLLFREK